MFRFATASIVAVAALSVVAAAPAATITLSAYQNSVYPADTRASGSATDSTYSIDGVHSTVELKSTDSVDSTEKVAPFFYAGTAGTAIGTLGDLARGGFTADWKLQSRDSTVPSYVGNIAAFRFFVDGPTAGTYAEVIWEAAYQSTVPTFTQGTNYNNVDIGSGKFYARYLGQNYGDGNNGGVNPLTLSALASGTALTPSATNPTFNDGTKIYGVTVSVGSGAGNYDAYVGDLNATFTAVPEPTTLAVFGLSAVGLLARRRRVMA